MNGHRCPNCDTWVECDKRNIGTGRKVPFGEYGPNHAAIHGVLKRLYDVYGTSEHIQPTPSSIRQELNRFGPPRQGRRSMWYDADCQTLLSDLVGWGYVDMTKAQKGRYFVYRFKKAVPAPTVDAFFGGHS